ncbi:hypothetical protein WH47_01883 [Habropoda laboriosa]|uniref:Uncharacterized protein n=1 Tax=Habropoda laboriosa TaxID=597456 RepID=A0A0L7QXX8_9HYME|nr:hypothetical protein WH47_01883 [Habropoda laboriosa]
MTIVDTVTRARENGRGMCVQARPVCLLDGKRATRRTEDSVGERIGNIYPRCIYCRWTNGA